MSGYQPKTGAACTCKRGQERDNCPSCEGTGRVIDFRAIRNAPLGRTPEKISDFEVVEAMARYGGSFVAALAEAYRRADAPNTAKLRAAFPEYWDEYTRMARQHKEHHECASHTERTRGET